MTIRTKEDVIKLSYQYQREWRFAKDKALMLEAKALFPDWNYADLRLEWHARPQFDRDLAKSKTQPRQPLHLLRLPEETPAEETLKSLCFVTTGSSKRSSFESVVQLLESLKTTRWYKDVPVKILDCGLTQIDANYLHEHFGCEVKKVKDATQEHVQPYMHKYFPGYHYYFWLDHTVWIQNERALDKLVYLCEKQGLAAGKNGSNVWTAKHYAAPSIAVEDVQFMKGKDVLANDIYCIRADIAHKHRGLFRNMLEEAGAYKTGFDLAVFNYVFYKEVAGVISEGQFNFAAQEVKLDDVGNLCDLDGHILGIVHLNTSAYRGLFANSDDVKENLDAMQRGVQLFGMQNAEFSELKIASLCEKHGWKQGSLSYRTYVDPVVLYGEMDQWLDSKLDILKQSYQFQREWRFEKDKELMLQAKKLFPDWDYVDIRLEWHSRPEFHRDPEKSRVQPRQPLHLPRDPDYIPKQETMESLCFVTGTNSAPLYFNLTVELLESIKATQHYNNIPIKVVDFGLTEEDIAYLEQRFNAEVKDPGWDVDVSKIDFGTTYFKNNEKLDLSNVLKLETSRGYYDVHFPGYEYYLWIESDLWVQNDRALDRLVCVCEKQGLSLFKGFNERFFAGFYDIPIVQNAFSIEDFEKHLSEKSEMFSSCYCINKEFLQHYRDHEKEVSKFVIDSTWPIINYIAHKHIENFEVINELDLHFPHVHMISANNVLYTPDKNPIGIINLYLDMKHFPRRMLFSEQPYQEVENTIQLSKKLYTKPTHEAENEKSKLCETNYWSQDSYFYRTYLAPEKMHGPLHSWLKTKSDILKLSYQYQHEWCFEKDKELMLYAKTLFPDWIYVDQRLEWHSRPEFHRKAEKSKTQPRKILDLPRNPNYIPKQETIERSCFVTATSSNPPYFALAVQLIESIKATKNYNNIPIKIFDCGLAQEDAQYLYENFNCEIKDPGWDLEEHLIDKNAWHDNPNAFKGSISRICCHKHFPGYEYYIWMDCDIWFQTELSLDRLLSICEEKGCAGTRKIEDFTPIHAFDFCLTEAHLNLIVNKPGMTGGLMVMHKNFLENMTHEMHALTQSVPFQHGTDDALMIYTLYKYIRDPIISDNRTFHAIGLYRYGVHADLDENQYLKINNEYIHSISLHDDLKHLPYCVPFSQNPSDQEKIVQFMDSIKNETPLEQEEILHQMCLKHGWKKGSYHYRIYPTPESLYGALDKPLLIKKEDVLRLSYQYQHEWRFEKDKELMLYAKTLFPDWDYVDHRLEWYSRPEFHRDPEKSRVQPRQPLYLPRDPNYIPKQETMDSLCFVMGTSSNEPYFDLAIQLIESIKATQSYSHIPIKVLDCGLSQEDSNYLHERFECEVKDPGWDIDPNIINKNAWHDNLNAFKNMTVVHCLHKHFPEYQYYIWLDCDQWIQSELLLDQQITLCEKQSIAGSFIRITPERLRLCWEGLFPEGYMDKIAEKPCITGGFWVAHRTFLEHYNHEMNLYVQTTGEYRYGCNDSILSYTMHKYIESPQVFQEEHLWPYFPEHPLHIDQNKSLKINNDFIRMLCVDFYGAKKNPLCYRYLFPNSTLQQNSEAINTSEELMSYPLDQREEKAHQLCIKNGWQQGNYLYRIYPTPESLYGKQEDNL
ncbi:MAG: hypothetical protein H6850_01790 [Alphaproteobacteria bacterium]|nr:MAG: hypothetical protein H6850_01790 [Alphaproteobacteria bacterium]